MKDDDHGKERVDDVLASGSAAFVRAGDLDEALQRIAGSPTSATRFNVQTIIETSTEAAADLSGAQFGAFFRSVTAGHAAYELHTLIGVPREVFEHVELPQIARILEPTFRGEAVRLDDATADRRYLELVPHPGMSQGHLPIRSYLATPILTPHGDVMGGLLLGHAEPGVFTEHSEQAVVAIAGCASQAIENAHRRHEAYLFLQHSLIP